MKIRKLTLEEWFLGYQLKFLNKNGFYIPAHATIDVTALAERYRAAGMSMPYTAIMVKAAGVMAARCPAINRLLTKSLFGDRVIEFDRSVVNMPVAIEENGRLFLTAVTIADADKKSIAEINQDIATTRKKRIKDLFINRYFIANHNTFKNRLQLKIFHFLAFRFPALYVKKGGGAVAVSSLHNVFKGFASLPFLPMSFSNTNLTICLAAPEVHKDGRTTVSVGFGMNHMLCSGIQLAEGIRTFCSIFESGEAVDLLK